jgi:hypothetical protein
MGIERPIGWKTMHEAEETGLSLVSCYLYRKYPEQQEEWGTAFGRAVYEAWPNDGPYVDEFIEPLIEELEGK